MTLRMDGRVAVFDGEPVEADDVFFDDGDLAGLVGIPTSMRHIRKVGFFRGSYEVAVSWGTGMYGSNATELGAAIHGRSAVAEFVEEPDTVEVAVARRRDGDLLPVVTSGGWEGQQTLRFVPTGQVPRILEYVAGLPPDAETWEWATL